MKKTELPCGIVEDLLPSYVDGLTGEESSEAVREHLSGCETCRKKYEAMKKRESAEHEDTQREVNYLKTVHRSTLRRVLLAVVCTAVVLFAAAGAKIYLIGTPATAEGLDWAISIDEETGMWVEATGNRAGTAYDNWDVDIDHERGIVSITGRQYRASPVHNLHGLKHGLDPEITETVREVYLCGELIWADGVAIWPTTLALYEAVTPYTGDAPALSVIADRLYVRRDCGDFTNELQTSAEPFGWTLHFSATYPPGSGAWMDARMKPKAEMMLAVVGNLGAVIWDYRDDAGQLHTQTVTLEEVNARLPDLVEQYNALYHTDWVARDSVKDYAESPATLEQLRCLLELVH